MRRRSLAVFLRRTTLVLVPSLLTLVGCSGDAPAPEPGATPVAAEATSSPAVATSPVTSGAQIVFERMEHDFGTFNEIEERTASLPFHNAGDSTLVIQSVKATCGCTVPSMKKLAYEPGERGTLDIRFDPTGPGDQKKFVSLVTNSRTGNVSEIVIRANVVAFIEIEPRMAQFNQRAFGQEHRMQLKVSSPDPDFELTNVTTSSEFVHGRVLAPEERPAANRTAEFIEVQVAENAPWGGNFGVINITMRGRPTPESDVVTHTTSIRFAARLFGQLTADPDTFRFGGKTSETFSREVILTRPDGRPFAAEIVGSETAGILVPSVRLEQHTPNAFKVILEGTTRSTPAQYTGWVDIRTDVGGGEETVRIPIAGFVRAQ